MDPFKKDIQFKDILNQIKADLIGKDSYRGVTFTYSWLANQFGHFSLGYIPTLIAFSIIKTHTSWTQPSFWAALIVSLTWLLFETYNFLGPLLLQRKSKSKFMYIPSKSEYIFSPEWGNIAFDTITDLMFFWLGAFSAGLFLTYSSLVCTILFCLSLAVLYPAYYWFLTKMYLQCAKFPMQLRLSQWKGINEEQLPETDIKTVLSFVENSRKSLGNHLLIFGGRRSGKSTLAIGIGTELSIKRCPSSYYTGMKWLNLLSLNNDQTIEAEGYDNWSWRTSSLLIIDDINPGNPIPTIFMSSQDILDIINTPVDGDGNMNKEDLINKNVIWVLGDGAFNSAGNWPKMLLEIGVQESAITAIDLGFNFM